MKAVVNLHAKRGTPIPVGKEGQRFVQIEAPLDRFLRYCQFDPGTGCVVWTGGTCTGQGKNALYGTFWFEGKAWRAHRWSAKYVHGLNIEKFTVDHCCPNTGGLPNTLCVEHVQAKTNKENVLLMFERQKFLMMGKGFLEADPAYVPDPEAFPWYSPPEWYAKGKGIIAPVEPPF